MYTAIVVVTQSEEYKILKFNFQLKTNYQNASLIKGESVSVADGKVGICIFFNKLNSPTNFYNTYNVLISAFTL